MRVQVAHVAPERRPAVSMMALVTAALCCLCANICLWQACSCSSSSAVGAVSGDKRWTATKLLVSVAEAVQACIRSWVQIPRLLTADPMAPILIFDCPLSEQGAGQGQSAYGQQCRYCCVPGPTSYASR